MKLDDSFNSKGGNLDAVFGMFHKGIQLHLK